MKKNTRKSREIMLKNTFKILASRFHQVWGLLMYYIIALAVISGLSVVVLIPVFNAFGDADIPGQFLNLFNRLFLLEFATLQDFLNEFVIITESISGILFLPSNITGYIIMFFVLIVVVARFAFGLAQYPTVVLIDAHMSSNASYNFSGKYILNIGRSSVYQLGKMLFSILADAIIIGGLYGLSWLFYVPNLRIFTPAIMIVFFMFTVPLKMQLFACWAPAIIAGRKKLFQALSAGAKITFGKGRGLKIYTCYFFSVFLFTALTVFLGVFTLGAGLLILAPVCVLFSNVLGTVIYYSGHGKRYYADSETVITSPAGTEN